MLKAYYDCYRDRDDFGNIRKTYRSAVITWSRDMDDIGTEAWHMLEKIYGRSDAFSDGYEMTVYFWGVQSLEEFRNDFMPDWKEAKRAAKAIVRGKEATA